MPVLPIVRWLLLAAEAYIALPILYLCMLSVSAILFAKKRRAENSRPTFTTGATSVRFAVLIPAHNEETILGTLLESLSKLAYPKDLYSVYVIADNCTDGTAEVVRSTDWAHVRERSDQARQGKGYALNWILRKLEEDQLTYDAYVILDADSVVIPTFLQAMARELVSGAQALQAHNTTLNTAASPGTALRWIALTLVNHVRSLGRNGIGASAKLSGNGMCLRRSLLLRHPWQAFSITEDYEYYLRLIEHGERVHYVPEAVVRSLMPITFAQMRTQDIRWEASESRLARWQAILRLLRAGLKCHDFARIEAIAEYITPPLSFIVCWSLLMLITSLAIWSVPGLVVSLALIGGLLYYIGTGLYLLHPPRRVYIAFLQAPVFMLWKLWVYFVLRRSKKYTSEWIRTSRSKT